MPSREVLNEKIASAFVNIAPVLEKQWYNPNNLDPEWAKEELGIEKIISNKEKQGLL